MGKNDLDTERFSIDPQFAVQYSEPATEPIQNGRGGPFSGLDPKFYE